MGDFPSFSEGLSFGVAFIARPRAVVGDFPSFSEGLSLRQCTARLLICAMVKISLPVRKGFH